MNSKDTKPNKIELAKIKGMLKDFPTIKDELDKYLTASFINLTNNAIAADKDMQSECLAQLACIQTIMQDLFD